VSGHGTSRHNLHYWRGLDYIGVGPGACSRISRTNAQGTARERWAFKQVLHPNKWVQMVENSQSFATIEKELLSPAQILEEILLGGLRTRDGISHQDFFYHSQGKQFHEVLWMSRLKELEDRGLIKYDSIGLRVSQKGLILLDSILPDIFSSI